MKEIKNFYIGVFLVATVVICSVLLGFELKNHSGDELKSDRTVINTNYGSFLAAQHALFVNDFESASKMLDSVNVDIKAVNQSKDLSDFLVGKMPKNPESLAKDKKITNSLIYDAYLIKNGNWKKVYDRHHSKDDNMFSIPLRVFSSVKQGKKKEALKFVESLHTSATSKAFLRGQIAVVENDIDAAAKEFAKVDVDFMNLVDYLYLMSFYRENGMLEDMDILRDDFIVENGGTYVLDYPDIPDWSVFAGYENNVAFSFLQTVSHTQFLMYTDLSLILLRFSQIISDNANADAINYYLGDYLYYNSGDYKKAFGSISKKTPLYLFGQMAMAQYANDIDAVKKIANKHPLFVPAVGISIENDIKNGNKRAALRTVNRALNQDNLSDKARVYFLKHRIKIYLAFDDAKEAQKDIDEISSIDNTVSADMLLLQANVWAKQDKNLDKAYEYAMLLIKKDTSDVLAWDTLGVIIEKREGVLAALDLMQRVGEIAVSVSSLYEHLGDYYKKIGDKEKARRSYLRAIDLSDDGLVVVPYIQKKIRNLK